MNVRYAIYFSPDPQLPLSQTAAQWLERDEHGNRVTDVPLLYTNTTSPDHLKKQYIATPAHYGFHATIKPPFMLAKGYSEQQLDNSLQEFCRLLKPFTLPKLQVSLMGSFFCLTLAGGCDESASLAVDRLAEETVRHFDIFRRPPTEKELAKRRETGLTDRQDEMLRRWGYPYLLSEFRFHMTLSEKLKHTGTQEQCHSELSQRFYGEMLELIPFDSLCLFREVEKNPFTLVRRYALS